MCIRARTAEMIGKLYKGEADEDCYSYLRAVFGQPQLDEMLKHIK